MSFNCHTRRLIYLYLLPLLGFLGCGGSNSVPAPEPEPPVDVESVIKELESRIIQGETQLRGNPCFEDFLKPNIENVKSLLERNGVEFISRTPFLVDAYLMVAPKRKDEFLLTISWLSTVENFAGIRVIEFWELEEDGIGMIDERYKIFSDLHDHEFYGTVPSLHWGVWVEQRSSFETRKDASAWSNVDREHHENWLEGLPEIFIGDPRGGVKVFVSIFDVQGRESRWFPREVHV